MNFNFQYALAEISRYVLIVQCLSVMCFNWHVAKLENKDNALLGVGVHTCEWGYVLVWNCHLAFLGRNSSLFWNYVFAILLLLQYPFSFILTKSLMFYDRFYYTFSLHVKIYYAITITQFYPNFVFLWKK